MQAHHTLPHKIQKFIKKEELSIHYLVLYSIHWFLYKKDIWINTSLDLYKKRFTILHELSHYIHWDSTDIVWVPYWKNPNEKRADNFAMKVLLPKRELLRELETHEWDLNILEKIFWVEKRVIEKRIKGIKFDSFKNNWKL